MALDLLLPTVGLPLLVMALAAATSFRQRWSLTVGAFLAVLLSFALIETWWQKGLSQIVSLKALDGIWLLAALALLALRRVSWGSGAIGWLVSLVLSIWLVRVFAHDIAVASWLAHGLVFALVWIGLGSLSKQETTSWVSVAFWLAPAAIWAPTIGLAGSIKIAQLVGSIGVTGALVWLFWGWLTWQQRPELDLASLASKLPIALALPLGWSALAAHHLVEVELWVLAPGLAPWVIGLVLQKRPMGAVGQWAILVPVSAASLALSLWMAWPEQSLY